MKVTKDVKIVFSLVTLIFIGLIACALIKYTSVRQKQAVTAQNKITEANLQTDKAQIAQVAAAKILATAKIVAATKLADQTKTVAALNVTTDNSSNTKIIINNEVNATSKSTSNSTSNSKSNSTPNTNTFQDITSNYIPIQNNTYNFTFMYPNFLTLVGTNPNNSGYSFQTADGTTFLSLDIYSSNNTTDIQYQKDMKTFNAVDISYSTNWYLISYLDDDGDTVYYKDYIDTSAQEEYTEIFTCPTIQVAYYQPYIDRFSSGFFSENN